MDQGETMRIDEQTFQDILYEEASIAASELVGPNSPEYEELTEALLEDEQFCERVRRAYED